MPTKVKWLKKYATQRRHRHAEQEQRPKETRAEYLDRLACIVSGAAQQLQSATCTNVVKSRQEEK